MRCATAAGPIAIHNPPPGPPRTTSGHRAAPSTGDPSSSCPGRLNYGHWSFIHPPGPATSSALPPASPTCFQVGRLSRITRAFSSSLHGRRRHERFFAETFDTPTLARSQSAADLAQDAASPSHPRGKGSSNLIGSRIRGWAVRTAWESAKSRLLPCTCPGCTGVTPVSWTLRARVAMQQGYRIASISAPSSSCSQARSAV